jgi:hypothetical protein
MTDTLLQVESRPPASDYDLIRSLTDLYETSKANRGQVTGEWKRNYRLTMNRTTAAVPTATGVRANEIFPAVSSRIAWMTDQEIACSIVPAADPWDVWGSTVAEAQATHLESVINSIYYADYWYIEIVKMLWDAAIYGTGFLKIGWDSGKLPGQGPTGESLGNVVCRSTSPWCLYPDPYATSATDARWICEVHTLTPEEIQRRFPAASSRLITESSVAADSTDTHRPPSQRAVVDKEGPQLIPVNAGQGPTTWGSPGGAGTHRGFNVKAQNVYEMWWKENVREERQPSDPNNPNATEPVVTDRWRVTCWSGTTVLLDEYADNLFGIDTHPYVRYVDDETNEFYGSALLRDLGPCQVAMNRLLAMAQNNTEYTGNPVLIGVKGSGVDRSTWLNRAGQIYDVNGGPNAAQNRPDWLQPPNLPTSLMDLIGLWRDEIERISGLQGPQKGNSTPTRTSNAQVQATQEAGFIRIRSSQRNLEITLSRAFTLAAQLIIVNYDVPRTVAIVGPEGVDNALKLSASHFIRTTKSGQAPLKFTLLVNAGASKPTSRSARFAEALQLKEVGAVDNQYVLEAARVKHIPQVMQRLQAQQQAEMQMQAQAHSEKGQTHEK